jgi:hypothetical protein
MPSDYVGIDGERINPEFLKHRRSGAIVRAARELPYFSFIEAKSQVLRDGYVEEGVIVDVEPEIPQNVVYDIRRVERIAILIPANDDKMPEVWALRADFPRVPHTNLRTYDVPKSLCLYDDPGEVALTWTGAKFLEDIRVWLSRTAKGELHRENQPLEPFIVSSHPRLILPWDCLTSVTAGGTQDIVIRRLGTDGRTNVLIGRRKENVNLEPSESLFRILFIDLPVQTHGVINTEPIVFQNLRILFEKVGIDLLSLVRDSLKEIISQQRSLRPKFLLVVVRIAKRRSELGNVESYEWWSFWIRAEVHELGCAIGIWQKQGADIGSLLAVDTSQQGDGVPVETLNTTFSFNKHTARLTSKTTNLGDYEIGVIGCGAIGSQVFLNLVRMGIGQWFLVDDDILLPHNLARHAAFGDCVGHSKSFVLSELANAILDESVTVSFDEKILQADQITKELKGRLYKADYLLDATTSLSATRTISRDVDSQARRMAIFVNPNGTDAVLLCEDRSRSVRLDALEMQYYRLVITNPRLKSHLRKPETGMQYSNSCRDVSTTIPQDNVAILSGLLTRGIREQLARTEAIIRVWSLNENDLDIESLLAPCVYPVNEIDSGEWKIIVDHGLLEKITSARQGRLPNETGGVLVGCHDTRRKIIYIVDTILSPPDSKERKTAYIRGAAGLKKDLLRIKARSGEMVNYVGEWHSHPRGNSAEPSLSDLSVLKWLDDIMRPFGMPALMMIAGDSNNFGYCLSEP